MWRLEYRGMNMKIRINYLSVLMLMKTIQTEQQPSRKSLKHLEKEHYIMESKLIQFIEMKMEYPCR